ncbi:MAG TPA: glycosyltransferase family 87 protein [Anaerolineaceae bacterium]|nr:glycosyltransferase family 87 protein [Anaerolineaceae bacterium]
MVNLHTYQNSDFFTFWLSGRMVLSGRDPYLSEAWLNGHTIYGATWIPNQSYPYPLPHAIFFAPLSLLPLYEAFVAWVFLSQWFILVGLIILLMDSPQEFHFPYFIPLAAGLALFRPTIVQMVNGQFSGFMFLVLAGVVMFWKNEKWWQGGFILALLALKPNIGLPIIGLIVIYLLVCRKGKAVLAILIGGFILFLAGIIVNSGWVFEFLSAGGAKLMETFGHAPSIWGLSSLVCNSSFACIVWVGSIISILLISGFIFLVSWKKGNLTIGQITSLSIVLSLLITTHIWPYDQLLLMLPVIILTVDLAVRGRSYVLNALIVLALDVLAIVSFLFNMKAENEIASTVLTIAILGLILWWIFSPAVIKSDPVNQPAASLD